MCVVSCAPLVVVFHGVHSWQVVQGFEALGPAGCRLWSSSGARPTFWSLSRFVIVVSLANMPLFVFLRRFLARFGAFVWVCVVLVLCVACGAFVRVYS